MLHQTIEVVLGIGSGMGRALIKGDDFSRVVDTSPTLPGALSIVWLPSADFVRRPFFGRQQPCTGTMAASRRLWMRQRSGGWRVFCLSFIGLPMMAKHASNYGSWG
jgi:hypothetical protein